MQVVVYIKGCAAFLWTIDKGWPCRKAWHSMG